MGVYLKGITEDVFKEISWECVYLALKRQDRIVEVPEPHGRLIDADALRDAVYRHLCIKGEENLLPAEKSVFGNIIKAPTVIEGSNE